MEGKEKLYCELQSEFQGRVFLPVDQVVMISQQEGMPVKIRLTHGNDLLVTGSLDEVMKKLNGESDQSVVQKRLKGA